MSRMNIWIDDILIKKCIKITGIKTHNDLVEHALRELLRHKNQKKLIELIELKRRVDCNSDSTSLSSF